MLFNDFEKLCYILFVCATQIFCIYNFIFKKQSFFLKLESSQKVTRVIYFTDNYFVKEGRKISFPQTIFVLIK